MLPLHILARQAGWPVCFLLLYKEEKLCLRLSLLWSRTRKHQLCLFFHCISIIWTGNKVLDGEEKIWVNFIILNSQHCQAKNNISGGCSWDERYLEVHVLVSCTFYGTWHGKYVRSTIGSGSLHLKASRSLSESGFPQGSLGVGISFKESWECDINKWSPQWVLHDADSWTVSMSCKISLAVKPLSERWKKSEALEEMCVHVVVGEMRRGERIDKACCKKK